ncbi:hypothetical protein LJC71_01965 [Desulfosarcina sp. OttesenSCG-928-A07]|nr:hypothetical protein [Desulfosarcina sp. OttesenSCG-928-A07]
MTDFMPVSLNHFVRVYLSHNPHAEAEAVRAGVEDALAAWRHGVRCSCGNPIWVAGSAVAGYGCFACITGNAQPDGDMEIDQVMGDFFYEITDPEACAAQVSAIMRNHPHDYRERLEEIGFIWEDDEYEKEYEEEVNEERAAVPETRNQRLLIQFFKSGEPVTKLILDAYFKERYAEDPNLPLIRTYFKQASPQLKAILLKGLALDPTNPDLLDDLAYFSEFDSMLGQLVQLYTDACIQENDMERFSVLAQEFYQNTIDQGYDALQELSVLFPGDTKGAVIQQLMDTVDLYSNVDDFPF